MAVAWRELGRQDAAKLMDSAGNDAEHKALAARAIDSLKHAAAVWDYVAGHLDCFELVARDRRRGLAGRPRPLPLAC